MTFRITAIDHVQLAMPVGAEQRAVDFYAGILGLVLEPKPTSLGLRGGCWFRSGNVEIHLGVEDPFTPAKKAHPALRVAGYSELIAALEAAGYPVRVNDEIPGVLRCHVDDPFGNRIELIAQP
jgi:catechol 2,3-dioxygenase-like lactoylglutathione lyase family enzyme